MAVKKEVVQNDKIAVQSLLDSNLWYRDIIISAHEIVLLDKEYAEDLINKGFCKPITANMI